MSKSIILTGLRANGEFHLGNYLGAILPIVKLQKQHAGAYQINMFIPDLHSFTTPIEHGNLYQQTINNLKIFSASGLDISNDDTYVYRQSYIPAHSELAWILSCFTYFGELSRMTQFKEKIGADVVSDKESSVLEAASSYNISAGLYIYPILMAADILLYGAQYIPVGEDQRQHLELTRDLAIRINNKFGYTFVVPHEWSKQLEFSNLRQGIRVKSLRNPAKKMSKSVKDPSGTIMLSDLPDEAVKKIMSAETDSLGVINFDWEKQPGITNLLQILALLKNQTQEKINSDWVGKSSYGSLKEAVSEEVRSLLLKIQGNLPHIDEQELLSRLKSNEEKMNITANQRLAQVQKQVGLRP